jgi:hypothetical protein
VIDGLIESDDPTTSLENLIRVLSKEPHSPQITTLRNEIRTSPAVTGTSFAKPTPMPVGAVHTGSSPLSPKSRGAEGVPRIQGRYRRCASQQGNALYSITRLGLADKRSVCSNGV